MRACVDRSMAANRRSDGRARADQSACWNGRCIGMPEKRCPPHTRSLRQSVRSAFGRCLIQLGARAEDGRGREQPFNKCHPSFILA